MSTFCGRLREIPGISVDRFDGDNVHSRAFFLSHCHQDHMHGLNMDFFQNLTDMDRFLYTSDVSYAILSKRFPLTTLNVKGLSLLSPTMVHLDDGTILMVKTIPAGHCPGSVMFLFEGKERVLYTGDYRCGMNDFKKLKVFYNAFGKVETIDSLYLDTTFLLKRFHRLPKRTDSIRALVCLIKSAIANNQIVFLKTSAYYGYEQCFSEVFNEFKMPVHVGWNSYEFYKSLPEMDECVTQNPSVTRIHSNCGGYKKICETSQNIFTVTISVYSWTQSDLQTGVVDHVDPSNVRLCYSTHASYEEGIEFVKFLRPKRIEICVEPKEEADRLELEGTIRDILRQETKDEGDIPEYFDYRRSQRKKRESQAETQFSNRNVSKRVKDGFETSNTLGTTLSNDSLYQTDSTVPSLCSNASCNSTTISPVKSSLFSNPLEGLQEEHVNTATNNTLVTTLKDAKDNLNQMNSAISCDISSRAPVTCSVISTLLNKQLDDLQDEQTNNASVTSNDDLNQINTTIPPQGTNTSCNVTATCLVSSTLFNKHLESSRDILTDHSGSDVNSIGSLEEVSRADRSTSSDEDYFRQKLLNILGLETNKVTMDKIPERCPDDDLFLKIMSNSNTADRESRNESDPVLEVLNLRISPCRDTKDSEDSS